MTSAARTPHDRAGWLRRDAGNIPSALLLAIIVVFSLPAGATSKITTDAFEKLCLKTNMDREVVSTVAENMGMKLFPERVSQVSDSSDLAIVISELVGVPLTEMTSTGFHGAIREEVLPAGIVSLSLTMYEIGAADPNGQQVTIFMCQVLSSEEAGAARALSDVRRELESLLPAEAIAREPSSESRGRMTLDAMSWHWGNIDTDLGRVRAEYRAMSQQGSMGVGSVSVSRVVRAPQ
jgi:hypothetical protein